jgi:predicted component of type VI protein secretion system
MKKTILIGIATLFSAAAFAADTNSTPKDAEANYTKAIEGRTADILKVLALTDADKKAKVHDTIMAQYRALKSWHEENDAKLKTSKGDTNATTLIKASLKKLHDEFIARLATDLTAEQVEQVKDKMTYGKVQFTYKGYLIEYPDMNETQKAEVLRLLKDAREEAMDGGSADEKSVIFNRYKGKINNYLSKQGIHPEKKNSVPQSETNAPVR